jgi:hypothetical protein
MILDFSVADFRLGENSDAQQLAKRFLNFLSDNQKSETCPKPGRRMQNLKSLELVEWNPKGAGAVNEPVLSRHEFPVIIR